MKKGIIFVLLIVFLVFTSTATISADAVSASPARSFFGGVFGGRIINTKAPEIEILESLNFVCFVPGSSISIIPIGSPSGTPMSYFIPFFITPKTRTIPAAGQLILGKYSGKMTIGCILKSTPPVMTTVSLDIITLFGTSRI